MTVIFRLMLLACVAWLALTVVQAQTPAERMAATAMTRWQNSWETDPARTERWSYEQGVLLKGVENVWLNTADGKYFNFIQRSIDRFITDDGTIKTFKLEDYNLDNVNEGKLLLTLYRVTEKEKYKTTADHLR